MQGVFIPKDKDDSHDVVAIGKDAYVGGDLDDSRGAVIIGRNAAKNMVSGGGGNVLLGTDVLSSSTRSDSVFNVILGRSACQNHLLGITNNVIIGHQAVRDGSEDTMANNVIVGSNACRGRFVGSGVVAMGRRAGYRTASSSTTMGDNSIMIGADTNNGDSDIGSYSIAIGTANGQGITDDSVCIGRQAVCQGSGTGQMVLGNNSYNKTMVLCTSESTKIKTGAGGTLLTSLELTTDNAIMRSNAATTLTCGTNSLQVLANKYKFSPMPIVLSSPVICDADGKSLFVGSSKWISGRSDGAVGEPLETRRVAIGPNSYFADDDSSTRQVAIYTGEEDDDSLFPSQVSPGDSRSYGGARVQNASEAFINIDPSSIPHGWKVTAIYISFYSRSNLSAQNKTIEVFSRTRDFTASASPQNSDHIILHKAGSAGETTNSHVTLSPHFTPQGANTLYVFVSVGSSHSVFMGGYFNIQRI